MKFNYISKEKIFVNDTQIGFGEKRDEIRSKIGGQFEEHNEIIDLSTSISSLIVIERRDIYKNYNHTSNLFILKYNEEDFLIEIEVHNCAEITVIEKVFTFKDNLDTIRDALSSYSSKILQNQGDYLFEDLGIVIMDKKRMGSKGISLGYFYCAMDLSHLIEDYPK